MAAPLLAIQFDSDARPFAFGNATTQRFEKRFDVSEHDGCRRRSSKDCCKRFTVFGVHGSMIAKSAIRSNEGLLVANVEVTGPARFYRAASAWTAGLGCGDGKMKPSATKPLKPSTRFTVLMKERNHQQLVRAWEIDERVRKLAK